MNYNFRILLPPLTRPLPHRLTNNATNSLKPPNTPRHPSSVLINQSPSSSPTNQQGTTDTTVTWFDILTEISITGGLWESVLLFEQIQNNFQYSTMVVVKFHFILLLLFIHHNDNDNDNIMIMRRCGNK
jgi:hypothetical protein